MIRRTDDDGIDLGDGSIAHDVISKDHDGIGIRLGESGLVTFGNLGGVVLPVPYRVTFSDGETADYELPVQAWARSRARTSLIPASVRACWT